MVADARGCRFGEEDARAILVVQLVIEWLAAKRAVTEPE